MAPTDDVGATVLTKQISMKIEELGEFGLIRHVTEAIELKNQSSVKGVGDDCAVLRYDADREVLVTTDLLLEGVHFDLTYVPLKHLGYKSAVVNFSDVYAMGGEPRQITVSLGLSQRFSVEDIEELYAGLRLACEKYGVDIVGGDTSSSMTGLTISITCIGDVERGKVKFQVHIGYDITHYADSRTSVEMRCAKIRTFHVFTAIFFYEFHIFTAIGICQSDKRKTTLNPLAILVCITAVVGKR